MKILRVSRCPGNATVAPAGPWIAALARFVESRPLPPQDTAVLREQLASPVLRRVVIRAPAAHEHNANASDSDTVLGWLGQLAACIRSARDCALRQNLIGYHLASMPRPRFEATIASPREARAAAIEPKLRISLGTILANAPYWRVRPAERGLGAIRMTFIDAGMLGISYDLRADRQMPLVRPSKRPDFGRTCRPGDMKRTAAMSQSPPFD